MVVVVAKRERPEWSTSDAGDSRIKENLVELREVQLFTCEDAKDYLQRAEIANAEIATRLISFSTVEQNQIHPKFLDMCARGFLAAQKNNKSFNIDELKANLNFEEKSRLLLNRLLKYCDRTTTYAVEALAVTRRFDYSLCQEIGSKLGFSLSRPLFDELTKFAFIHQESGQHVDTFRVHATEKKFLQNADPEKVKHTHKVLQEYFEEKVQSDTSAVVEVIYHINCQEPTNGCHKWVENFDSAFKNSNYDLCEALVSLLPSLNIERVLARGHLLYFSGLLCKTLSKYEIAKKTFKEALEELDRVFEKDPDSAFEAHGNKGMTLLSLGELNGVTKDNNVAVAMNYFGDALKSFKQGLEIQPDDLGLRANCGLALRKMGAITASSNATEAKDWFDKARVTYDENLKLDLSFVPDGERKQSLVENNVGLAFVLHSLGRLRGSPIQIQDEKQYSEVKEFLKQAIDACEAALSINNKHKGALLTKASIFGSWADWEKDHKRREKAKEYIELSKTGLEEALKIAPQDVSINMTLGNASLLLAEILMSINKNDPNIEKSLDDSIKSLDQALKHAPYHLRATTDKGMALVKFGERFHLKQNEKKASVHVEEAKECLARAKELGPENNSSIERLKSAIQVLDQNLGKY